MNKNEIIEKTLREFRGEEPDPEYDPIVIAELERRLPDAEIKTCDDFRHLGAECCEDYHAVYPHYRMIVLDLPDGTKAWVCGAVEWAIYPERRLEFQEKLRKSQEGKRKVLVCDADKSLLEWLTPRLSGKGFLVECTEKGDGALDMYSLRRPYEYVLTEYLFIPGRKVKNGLELVHAIREIEPMQRIILQTSDRGLRAPCPVIFKPYNLHQLLRRLKEPIQPYLF